MILCVDYGDDITLDILMSVAPLLKWLMLDKYEPWLVDMDLTKFKSLKGLQIIDEHGEDYTIIDKLETLSTLEQLVINREGKFPDNFNEILKSFTHLKRLEIVNYDHELTLDHISHLQELETLAIPLNDNMIEQLGIFPKLKNIYVVDDDITDADLSKIPSHIKVIYEYTMSIITNTIEPEFYWDSSSVDSDSDSDSDSI
jgi:hypothetical protein